MSFNIITNIEQNDVNSYEASVNSKLLSKLKEKFTDFENKMFISHFYCYLNKNQKDFVVNLDDIWEWLGFARKENAKKLLEKEFEESIDYQEQKNEKAQKTHGGSNKIDVMMSIKTFKLLCLKANTKRATQIHNYYLTMQDIMLEVMNEEASSLADKLKQNTEEAEANKLLAVEKTMIEQFPLNTECLYIGKFNHKNKIFYKFGQSNNLGVRVKDHRKTYDDFVLMGAFRVENKIEIENMVKKDKRIKPHITSVEVNGKRYKEIIKCCDEFNFDELMTTINKIIKERQYSIDNFNKFVNENMKLKDEVEQLKVQLDGLRQDKNDIIEKNAELKASIVNVKTEVAENDDKNNDMKKWIYDHCLVGADKQVSCKKIEGWYRITTGNKIELFIKYLKKIFEKNNHLPDPNKPGSTCSGFIGVELKEIDNSIYNIKDENSNDAEYREFIETNCEFVPEAKVNMEILTQRFITLHNKKEDKITIKKEFKKYLKRRKDIYHTNLTTCDENGKEVTGLGFHGMNLKGCIAKQSKTSSTAKAVEKVCQKTGKVLGEWSCMREAAEMNSMSGHPAMSRAVKDKKLFAEGDMVVFYREKATTVAF